MTEILEMLAGLGCKLHAATTLTDFRVGAASHLGMGIVCGSVSNWPQWAVDLACREFGEWVGCALCIPAVPA